MFGKRPPAFRRDTVVQDYEGNGVELGVLFMANRLGPDAAAWEIYAMQCTMANSGTIRVGDRDTERDFAWHVGALRYFISGTGALLHASAEDESKVVLFDEHENSDPSFEYVVPKFQDNLGWSEEDLQQACALGMQFLDPFWLATSLMHCKNVTANGLP